MLKSVSRVLASLSFLLAAGFIFVGNLSVSFAQEGEQPPLDIIESDNPLVQQAGLWTPYTTDSASGGAYLYSSGSASDTLTLTFNGSRIEVVYVTHPTLGSFDIQIDGQYRTTVATGEDASFGRVASVGGLGEGEHTLTLIPNGVIAIDGFRVASAAPTVFPAPPAGDDILSPRVVNAANYTDTLNVFEATIDANDPPMGTGNVCIDTGATDYSNTIWYQYQAGLLNVQVTVSTLTSNYDTVVAAYTGATDNLQLVTCFDYGDFGMSDQAEISFAATPGTVYYIMVAKKGATPAASDPTTLNISISIEPNEIGGVPTLTAPATNAIVSPLPAFTWTRTSSEVEDFYGIQVDNQNTFTSPEVNETSVGLGYTVVTPLPSGTYFWRVRGIMTVNGNEVYGDWSAVRSFTVDATPPNAPNLTAPASGSILKTSRFTFTWSAVPTATRYRLEVATDDTFTNIVTTTPAESTTASLALTQSLPQGGYYWRVFARDAAGNESPASIERYFEIDILLTPAEDARITAPANTNSVRPTFTWSAVPGTPPYTYTLQIDEDSDFSSPEYVATNLTTTTHTIPAGNTTIGFGIWYWRVLTPALPANFAFARSFSVVPPAPVAPVLTTPATGSVSNDNTVSLNWNAVTYSLPVQYEVVVDNQNTFASPEFTAITNLLETTSTTSALPDGTYSWRVRAVVNISNVQVTGAWSAVRTFTVDTVAPNAPTLTTPQMGMRVSNSRPTFTWAAVPGATRYRLELATTQDFSSLITATPSEATTNRLTLTQSLPQGLVWWRVYALDAAGNQSAASTEQSFELYIPLSPMGQTLTAPAGATSVRPTFTWAAVLGTPPHTYILQVDDDYDFSSPEYAVSNLTTTTHTPPANVTSIGFGYWYWRVLTPGLPANFAFPGDFSVAPPGPVAPVLTSPATASLFNTNTVNLNWNAVTYGYPVLYEVVVDNQNTFASPEFTDTTDIGELTTITSALSDGTYSWRVRAVATVNFVPVNGAWSAPRTFTIDTTAPGAPNLNAPANAAIITASRPVFSWGAVAGANRYRLQVATDDTFTNIVTTTPAESTTASLTLTQSLPQGTYYWRAYARDAAGNEGVASATRSFTINILNAPANDGNIVAAANANSARPTFSWVAVPGAANPAYTLQVDNNADFSSPELTQSGLTTTSHTPPQTTFGFGRWYWRVNVNGLPSNGIVSRTFTITPPPPPAPTLVSPPTNSLIPLNEVGLTWNAPNYGFTLSYNFQVDNQANFASPEINATFPITSVALTSMSDGVYSWRVRAVATINDVEVFSAWSAVRTFTLDTTAPNTPTLNAPGNNATLSNSRPTFSWGAVPTATRYRLEVAVDEAFTQIIPTTPATSTTPSLTLTQSLTQGILYWRVFAIDAAGNESAPGVYHQLNINILLMPTFDRSLIPATGQNSVRPTFTWAAVPGTPANTYTLQIDNNEDFSSPEYATSATTATSHTLPAGNTTLTYGTWYWRVLVTNQGGNYGWSRFEVRPAPPTSAPTLLMPAQNALLNASTVTINMSWNAVAPVNGNAVYYQVQMDDHNTFSSPAEETTPVSQTNIAFNAQVLTDGTYFWRVRAFSYNVDSAIGSTPGPWSAVRTFTLDTTPPPAVPFLITPSSTTIITAQYYFEWVPVNGAAYYEVVLLQGATPVTLTPSTSTTNTLQMTAPIPQGSYSWYVLAYDSAGNAASPTTGAGFNVNILLTPQQNQVTNSTPTFTWEPVPGVTGYTIQIDNNEDFSSQEISQAISGGATTTYTVPLNMALPLGTYYWRVIPNGMPETNLPYRSFEVTSG